MAQAHRQTDRHTDGHDNSMTESAQWDQFSENSYDGSGKLTYNVHMTNPHAASENPN